MTKDQLRDLTQKLKKLDREKIQFVNGLLTGLEVKEQNEAHTEEQKDDETERTEKADRD